MISVVFDLDGTLVDSIASIQAAANALMSELKLDLLDAAETRAYVGRGAAHFLDQALHTRDAWNAQNNGERLKRFLVHYAAVPGAASPPLPGVDEALHQLRATGHRLAICTNKPTAPTQAILQSHGWEQVFDALVCGDSLPQRKPDPAPLLESRRLLGGEPILFVGDSDVDAATARAADIPFILYTEGYRKQPIGDLPHAAHFDDFDHLAGLIQSLCGDKSTPTRQQ